MALPNTFINAIESENFDGVINIPEKLVGSYMRLKVQQSFLKKEVWRAFEESGRREDEGGILLEHVLVKLELWGLKNSEGDIIPFDREGKNDESWNIESNLKP
jgi:hypothetical protein